MTIPVAPLVGLAAGLAPPVLEGLATGNWPWMVDRLTAAYTGVTGTTAGQPKFDPNALMAGMLPLLGGIMVHKIVGGKLGVNAVLARSGVPYIRL